MKAFQSNFSILAQRTQNTITRQSAALVTTSTRETKSLQQIITSEKTVLNSLQAWHRETIRAREALVSWGISEGDTDLQDVTNRLGELSEMFEQEQGRITQVWDDYRCILKEIRNMENALSEHRKKKENIYKLIEKEEKKLANAKPGADLILMRQKITEYRNDASIIDQENLIAETRLLDFKRQGLHRAYKVKIDAMKQFANCIQVVADKSMIVLDQLDLTETKPGEMRPDYYGREKTRESVYEARYLLNSNKFYPTTIVKQNGSPAIPGQMFTLPSPINAQQVTPLFAHSNAASISTFESMEKNGVNVQENYSESKKYTVHFNMPSDLPTPNMTLEKVSLQPSNQANEFNPDHDLDYFGAAVISSEDSSTIPSPSGSSINRNNDNKELPTVGNKTSLSDYQPSNESYNEETTKSATSPLPSSWQAYVNLRNTSQQDTNSGTVPELQLQLPQSSSQQMPNSPQSLKQQRALRSPLAILSKIPSPLSPVFAGSYSTVTATSPLMISSPNRLSPVSHVNNANLSEQGEEPPTLPPINFTTSFDQFQDDHHSLARNSISSTTTSPLIAQNPQSSPRVANFGIISPNDASSPNFRPRIGLPSSPYAFRKPDEMNGKPGNIPATYGYQYSPYGYGRLVPVGRRTLGTPTNTVSGIAHDSPSHTSNVEIEDPSDVESMVRSDASYSTQDSRNPLPIPPPLRSSDPNSSSEDQSDETEISSDNILRGRARNRQTVCIGNGNWNYDLENNDTKLSNDDLSMIRPIKTPESPERQIHSIMRDRSRSTGYRKNVRFDDRPEEIIP